MWLKHLPPFQPKNGSTTSNFLNRKWKASFLPNIGIDVGIGVGIGVGAMVIEGLFGQRP